MTEKDPWQEALKGVKPLKKGTKKLSHPRPGQKPSSRGGSNSPPYELPKGGLLHQSTFDPLLYKKIETGKMPLEFRLDLHGMTEGRAFDVLCAVLETAYREGKRRGLVITGKGFQGKSPIRAALPKWLGAPRLARIVSSFDFASPRHGGEGAFYIALRKTP